MKAPVPESFMTLAHVFSCEFCEHLQATASDAEQRLLQNTSEKLLLCSQNLSKILIINKSNSGRRQLSGKATTLLRTSLQTFPWKFLERSKAFIGSLKF